MEFMGGTAEKGMLESDDINIGIRLSVVPEFINGKIDAITFSDFEIKRKNDEYFEIFFRLENRWLSRNRRIGNKQEVIYYNSEQGHLKAKFSSKTEKKKKKIK